MVMQRCIVNGPSYRVARNVFGTATRVLLRGTIGYQAVFFRLCVRGCTVPGAPVIWRFCGFPLCHVPPVCDSVCSVGMGGPKLDM